MLVCIFPANVKAAREKLTIAGRAVQALQYGDRHCTDPLASRIHSRGSLNCRNISSPASPGLSAARLLPRFWSVGNRFGALTASSPASEPIWSVLKRWSSLKATWLTRLHAPRLAQAWRLSFMRRRWRRFRALWPIRCPQTVNCVDATLNLLVAARAFRRAPRHLCRFIVVYGDTPTLPKHEEMPPNPISPYAVAKMAGEYYLQSFTRVYGLETVTLRYFNVFGPYQDPTSQYSGVLAVFCRKMLAGEQPTILRRWRAEPRFHLYPNVVHANLLAAAAPAEKVSGQRMNVATGAAVTLNQTFEIL
jgi:hypothetical protein